jgi:hypothetical protein
MELDDFELGPAGNALVPVDDRAAGEGGAAVAAERGLKRSLHR